MSGEDVFDELRRTSEQVAVFNEIAQALTSTLEPHEVLRSIITQVSALVRPTSWSLLLEDEKTGELSFELAFGDGAEERRGLRVARSEGIAGAAFSTGEVQVVRDVSTSADYARRFESSSETPTRSIIAIPLRAAGASLGVLELVNGLDARMTRDDLRVLKAIADYAAIAIANARNFRRVQELTITDDHTGLFNARHLRATLAAEVQRALRFKHPLS